MVSRLPIYTQKMCLEKELMLLCQKSNDGSLRALASSQLTQYWKLSVTATVCIQAIYKDVSRAPLAQHRASYM